jgi:hypothetical protein
LIQELARHVGWTRARISDPEPCCNATRFHRRTPSADDFEGQTYGAPALDQFRKRVPVDEVGKHVRDELGKTKAPELLDAPGSHPGRLSLGSAVIEILG